MSYLTIVELSEPVADVSLRGMWIVPKRTMDVGFFFIKRYRRLQTMNGTYRAAQRMRKDGCPLSLALQVLTR